MANEQKTITISLDEYNRLLESQKQVDELRAKNKSLGLKALTLRSENKMLIEECNNCDKYEQAVKDTAKEIFELLIKTAKAEYLCGLPNPNRGKLPVGILKVYAKERYGVEVE